MENVQEKKFGEKVWVQNIRSKKWDQEGDITKVRTAAYGIIVSYDLTVNGSPAIRHRKYLRKYLVREQAEQTSQTGQAADGSPMAPLRSSRQRAAWSHLQ